MSKKEKIYRLGELYCGPGGLALGAKKARITHQDVTYSIKHIWANDVDEDSCQTFNHNITNNGSSCAQLASVDKFIKTHLKKIDAFAYGFPCNDFSLVGEQNGLNGKHGGLYFYGIKIINKFAPYFFIAENVRGIYSANEGNAFNKILYELKSSTKYNYELTVHIYKAEEYGVPQTRHRIIIVGIRKDLKLKFKPPHPTHTPDNYITVEKTLVKKPIRKEALNHELAIHSERVKRRLENTNPGENAWTANLPAELKLNVKGARLSQIYKKLELKKPSYTITGSGGGGTYVYHWNQPRALTNRERARLQTFPDYYRFFGGKQSVRKQIGMAVPPKLSKIIFEAVLKTLAQKRYKSLDSGNLDHLLLMDD
ncbi:MAG: DNA (cytosine-5-)-methyltransferase [Bacteroidetes bacterium]|nr:DNA (cytosine-5-)-methyltransferase [Bacteroidota bacterium]